MSGILIWSPNYTPELTGIPPLVTDACGWLATRGHEVEVVTALPNYPQRRIDPAYRGNLWRSEVLDGVEVHRSWLRVRPGESFVDKVLYEASFTALSLPRVARRAVCVTEPARAAVTGLAVRLDLALEHENAGNRVARLRLGDVSLVLAANGFRVVRAERYGMYYRHRPGRVAALLSAPPLYAVSVAALRAANAIAGRAGNKLAVQAMRS